MKQVFTSESRQRTYSTVHYLRTSLSRALRLDLIYDVDNLLNWGNGEISGLNLTEIQITLIEAVNEALEEVVSQAQLMDTEKDILNLTAIALDGLVRNVFDAYGAFNVEDAFNKTALDVYEEEFIKVESLINNNPTEYGDLVPHIRRSRTLLNATLASAAQFQTEVGWGSSQPGGGYSFLPFDFFQLDNTQQVMAQGAERFNYNGKSFHENVDQAITVAEMTVDYLENDGKDEINTKLNQTLDEFFAEVDGYVNHAVDFINDEFGQCRPIYNSYYGVVRYLMGACMAFSMKN